MRYREKSETVEATQWFPGTNIPGVFMYQPPDVVLGSGNQRSTPEPYAVIVSGLGGRLSRLSPGDWVITKADGTRILYRPDTFEEHYEPIPAS